ncbi:Glutamine transport ATP-binding protein GlnQ [Pseudomonas syringae pv. actinidiae]|uniref:amino acid ABC transporter ATP-binding protein n=1 Tax=Pseudomonas syringae TaxID=317 RepID=UPI000A2386C6|nr:amino acid ABC transporter ATP-binding protein [Pseudomonas syringae]OSR64863.1 Glutamine transport ATP-binding protein GlnQ [Pseudomonas syringae pv. actinidiae]
MSQIPAVKTSELPRPKSAEVVIQMQNLKKWYDDFAVLNGVTLEVQRGERIVICGPSGSGKSTLIRCINGLEKFQSGQLLVNGTSMETEQGAGVVRKETGMVFQGFHLFPHMSALENCMLAPIRVLKTPKREARNKAEAFLKRVGLADKMNHYPSQLSGGQQQRVAIARAMCMNPKVLLLDEPTSALDPEMVKEVLDVVVGLAESGITLLCVTHEMGFARQAADRVIFMDRGQIVEQAPPEEFFLNPQSGRAKKFLGQILDH